MNDDIHGLILPDSLLKGFGDLFHLRIGLAGAFAPDGLIVFIFALRNGSDVEKLRHPAFLDIGTVGTHIGESVRPGTLWFRGEISAQVITVIMNAAFA